MALLKKLIIRFIGNYLITFKNELMALIRGIVNNVNETIFENGDQIIENTGINTTEITERENLNNRFFYCAKAGKRERNAGLDNLPEQEVAYSEYRENYKDTKDFVTHYPDGSPRPVNPTKNPHPTVKPLALMEYLCKLTRTPTGGIVIDPFMGSGTTGMACVNTDRDFIGIEMDEEYYQIARKRIEHANAILKEN